MLDDLRAGIEASRKEVIGHPIYAALTTRAACATFMEHHVWAVWDFMSLAKSLQLELTCCRVPWLPAGHPRTRRLINEIVLAEESDEAGDGYLSHFEMYLAAMRQAGASTVPIERFTRLVARGGSLMIALPASQAPAPAAAFTLATFRVIEDAPLHAQAAVFAFSREDIIPEMFDQLAETGDPQLALFREYLARHIDLDAEHGPMAAAMVSELCGEDPARWRECAGAVSAALDARRRLWDGTLAAIIPPVTGYGGVTAKKPATDG